MHSTLELPRYEDALVPVQPNSVGNYVVGCADKRGPSSGDTVLPNTYYQLLGGVETGIDVATAWEAGRPGSYVNGGLPVEEIDILVAGVAKAYGIELVGHDACAALRNRQAIARTQMSGSDYLRAKAAYGGGMSLGDYQQVTGATGRIHDAGLITPTRTALKALKTPRPDRGVPNGIPFARLAKTGDAQAFVVSHKPQHGFNVRELTRKAPAYINTVSAIDALHEALSNVLPVDKDLLRMAYAARLGAISGHHITHGDQEHTPYPLYVIDRDGNSKIYMPEDLQPKALAAN